jgi:hypothetical protein
LNRSGLKNLYFSRKNNLASIERTLIIHIGTHKTGTTSIQHSLFNGAVDSVQFLREIPDYGSFRGNLSHYLKFMFLDSKALQEARPRLNTLERKLSHRPAEEHRDFLLSFIRKGNQATTVLSAEWLSSPDGCKYLSPLIEMIRGHFVKIIIFGFIRSPEAWAVSSWKQNLKNISQPQDVGSLSLKSSRLDFLENAQQCVENYPEVSLKFLSFEEELNTYGCIVRAFCEAFHWDYHASRITRKNDSLSLEASALLLRLKRLYQEGQIDVQDETFRRLRTEITELPGQKYHFTRTITDRILPDLGGSEKFKMYKEIVREGEPKAPYTDSVEISSNEDFKAYEKEAWMLLKERVQKRKKSKPLIRMIKVLSSRG